MIFTTILHGVRKKFGLSCNEYCIADMIYHLSANPKAPVQGWCNQSRGKMGEEMGLSRRTVIDIVHTLIEKGLVERNEADFLRTTSLWYDSLMLVKQGVQKLHTQTSAETSHVVQEVHTTSAETSHQPSAETSHKKNNTEKERETTSVVEPKGSTAKDHVLVEGIGEVTADNIALYITGVSDTNRLSFLNENNGRKFPNVPEFARSIRAYQTAKNPPKPPMVKPTLEEVRLYLSEKNYPLHEAEKFWHHHESKGWKINGKPMEKWKSAVATWMNSPFRNNGKPVPTTVINPQQRRAANEIKIQ